MAVYCARDERPAEPADVPAEPADALPMALPMARPLQTGTAAVLVVLPPLPALDNSSKSLAQQMCSRWRVIAHRLARGRSSATLHTELRPSAPARPSATM